MLKPISLLKKRKTKMASYTSVVLNRLYAGDKLKVQFKNASEREAFRKALYREKSVQDAAASAILDIEEKQTLFFEKGYASDASPFAICWIGTDVRTVNYEVINESNSENESNQDEAEG